MTFTRGERVKITANVGGYVTKGAKGLVLGEHAGPEVLCVKVTKSPPGVSSGIFCVPVEHLKRVKP